MSLGILLFVCFPNCSNSSITPPGEKIGGGEKKRVLLVSHVTLKLFHKLISLKMFSMLLNDQGNMEFLH